MCPSHRSKAILAGNEDCMSNNAIKLVHSGTKFVRAENSSMAVKLDS